MAENSILSPVSLTSYFDNATGEARQANLFFYKAGTLDPISAFTDSGLAIPYPQPVATTGWGRVPPVYIGEIPPPGYRVRAFDQYQTLIEDLDGLPGALADPASVPPPVAVDPDALAKTGDIKFKWSNHNPEPGWIEITKGGTIGSPGSNATFQGDQFHALFLHLWQQDSPGDAQHVTLKVIPSKGANAEGDWSGEGGTKKQIYLPDARGRFFAGLDSQQIPATDPPSSTSLMLDKGTFADFPMIADTKMTPWNLGAFGGEAVHKLVKTELAVHFHDWIDLIGHSHAIQEPNSNQGHKHTATQTAHTHNLITSGVGSDNVLGRTLSGGSYSGGPNETPKDYAGVDVNTSSVAPAITLDYAVTGITLRNAWYFYPVTQPGSGLTNAFTGLFSKKPATMPDPPVYGANDDKWHNKTENYPLPNDNSNGTDMGDIPHNTLPPFLLFAVYMKL